MPDHLQPARRLGVSVAEVLHPYSAVVRLGMLLLLSAARVGSGLPSICPQRYAKSVVPRSLAIDSRGRARPMLTIDDLSTRMGLVLASMPFEHTRSN